MDKYFTVEEVAVITGVTGRTVRNYLKSGALTGRKVGGQWRFTQAEVQALFRTPGMEESDSSRHQAIAAFLAGEDSPHPRACSLAELPCTRAEAEQLRERLMAYAARHAQVQVEYHYLPTRQKARFFFTAPPRHMAVLFQLTHTQGEL